MRILIHGLLAEVAVFDRTGHRKYLNQGERKDFHIATDAALDLARRVFCLTIYHTGCRISEALNLTGERVDFHAKAIIFETLKRRKRSVFRSVPVPDDLLRLIARLLRSAAPPKRVWMFSRPTGYRIIKDCMSRAGITGGMACPKGLRHGFAMACIGKSIPLPTVKKWLGHSRLETTAIYLDAVGEEERAYAERLWEYD